MIESNRDLDLKNKIAIMQPYFFPYIGYFQLINAVNKFVIYDDVNFIKGGWINRNRILINGAPNYFNVEMKGASPFQKINEVKVNTNNIWRKKLLTTIEQNYKRAPYFFNVFPVIKNAIEIDSEYLVDYARESILMVCNYLEIESDIVLTSTVYNNKDSSRIDRILEICNLESADTYINLIGGMDLYKKSDFAIKNISLYFLQSNTSSYSQFDSSFFSHLSIIDVLMFNSKADVKQMLNSYFLV